MRPIVHGLSTAVGKLVDKGVTERVGGAYTSCVGQSGAKWGPVGNKISGSVPRE